MQRIRHVCIVKACGFDPGVCRSGQVPLHTSPLMSTPPLLCRLCALPVGSFRTTSCARRHCCSIRWSSMSSGEARGFGMVWPGWVKEAAAGHGHNRQGWEKLPQLQARHAGGGWYKGSRLPAFDRLAGVDVLPLVHMFLCRLYAFDIHCNSYFPLFVSLYGERQCMGYCQGRV